MKEKKPIQVDTRVTMQLQSFHLMEQHSLNEMTRFFFQSNLEESSLVNCVVIYKIIHVYYLNKLYNSFKKLRN